MKTRLLVIVTASLLLSGCAWLSRINGPPLSAEELDQREQQCETQGGVYLGGQDICAFGEGGP